MAEGTFHELALKIRFTADPDQLKNELEKVEKEIKKFEKEHYTNDKTESEIDEANARVESATQKRSSAQSYQKAAGGLNKVSDEGIKLLKTTTGLIEQIYQKLAASSPLLQSVENLFNLAMTLFFMPLGNALAEEMIPAVLQLVDDVMEMWDAFEGKSLEEIFSGTIEYGIDIFSGYFANFGETLSQHGGLLGSIGNALNTISNFIEKMPSLIEAGIEIGSFILDHLSEIIAAIIAFKVASLAMQVAEIAAIATSNSIAGWFGAGAVVAGVGTGILVNETLNNSVDTSKISGNATKAVGGNNYYTNYEINGLRSTDELTSAIKAANADETNTSSAQG